MIHQRDRKPRTPVERLRVLALLKIPMTRHQIADIMGCSYDSATQFVAQLQAERKIEPCGLEHGPNGKWWRTKFKAVEQRQQA